MSKGVVLLLLVFAAGLVILVLLIVALASARQKAATAGNLPPSRRPGPTDEALEGRLMENYQAAGVVLTVLLTLLLPILYIREPARQRAASENFSKESVELGRQTFETFCARCHGINATGGTVKRFTPPGAKTPVDFQAPNLVNYILSIQSDGKKRPQLDFQSLSNREAVALVRALRAG